MVSKNREWRGILGKEWSLIIRTEEKYKNKERNAH